MRALDLARDGDELLNWQRPDDTTEVYENAAMRRPLNPRAAALLGIANLGSTAPRIWAMWASDMHDGPPAGGQRLGHYRLDLAAGEAVWVPEVSGQPPA
jgi:hypothetical protein